MMMTMVTTATEPMTNAIVNRLLLWASNDDLELL